MYKALLLLLCTCFIWGSVLAQIQLQGKVFDFATKKEIPFVNIGIPGTNVGVTSTESGSFSVLVPAKYQSDTLYFYSLGYGKRAVPIPAIINPKNITVYLSEKTAALQAVAVTAKREKKQEFELGNRYFKNGINLSSNPLGSTGAAVALLISNKYPSYHKDLSYPLFLKSARLRISGNTMGNFKVRVRLYEVDSTTKQPGKDLLHESVIVSSGISKGWLNIDLSRLRLMVDQEFFIAFEWILDEQDRRLINTAYREYEKLHPESVTTVTKVVDGEEITLPHYGNFLSGVAFGVSLEPFSLNNYTSYFRYNSLGKWERASGILAARVTLSNYPAETPAPDKPTALKPKPECTGNDANCRARQLAQEFLDEEQVNGLQLAVNHKGKLVLSEALGLANTEKNMPVTTTTPFKVGSISKALTSAALLKLMAENKLDLDAPVQKYVPSFPVKKYPITTRQLAGHLAGIRHYDTSSAEAHYQDLVRNQHYESATAALAIIQTDTLLFKPGTRYHYSSYGWSIIGAVLEGAVKQPYLPYMQKNIWQPLRMQHTSGAVKDSLRNVCQGYYATGEPAVASDMSFNYPGAGLVSTAEDLVTFGTELLRGNYFNRQLVPQLFTSQKTIDGTLTHYGLGWNIIKDGNGRTVWFHAGRLLDGSGYLVIYPDEELVFAFLSNSPAGAEFDIQKLASIYYQK